MLPATSFPSLHRRAFREGGETVREGGLLRSCLAGQRGTQALQPIIASAANARGATVATGSKLFTCFTIKRVFFVLLMATTVLLCILRCIQVICLQAVWTTQLGLDDQEHQAS